MRQGNVGRTQEKRAQHDAIADCFAFFSSDFVTLMTIYSHLKSTDYITFCQIS
jgi:hypothetical protein